MTSITDLLAVPIEGPLSQGDSQTLIRYRQALIEQQDRIADLESRVMAAEEGAKAANASAPLVEHVELNGHIEIAEQCRDYLAHEMTDSGDPSGKLQDFVDSLRIVIDQLDRRRRQRNWYEVAYTAGNLKIKEHAVEKALAPVRDATRKLVSLIDDMGAFADDSDPRVMALAGPIGQAQADLWMALGLDTDAEHARLLTDIDSRCAVCGGQLAEFDCMRGKCSMQPRPERLYAPERAAREEAELRKVGQP